MDSLFCKEIPSTSVPRPVHKACGGLVQSLQQSEHGRGKPLGLREMVHEIQDSLNMLEQMFYVVTSSRNPLYMILYCIP